MSEPKPKRHYSTLTEAEKAEWDAEIDAEYQEAVAATKRPAKLKRDQRLIGCPWGFLADVRARTLNATALVVALYVFHLIIRNKSRIVKLTGAELTELKVDRSGRHKALRILAAAGLVQLHPSPPGCAAMVELVWRPREILWRPRGRQSRRAE